MRAEIEDGLNEGESLSEFLGAAALQAARRRKVEQAFLARGRSSLANAKKTGEFYPLRGVLEALQRLGDFLVEIALEQGDFDLQGRAVDAIRNGMRVLEANPCTCRKLGSNPRERGLIIPFGRAGHMALFEIGSEVEGVVPAVRPRRKDDDHWLLGSRSRSTGGAPPGLRQPSDGPKSGLQAFDRSPSPCGRRCPAPASPGNRRESLS